MDRRAQKKSFHCGRFYNLALIPPINVEQCESSAGNFFCLAAPPLAHARIYSRVLNRVWASENTFRSLPLAGLGERKSQFAL
jgi:hypothetical protein